MKNQNEAFLVFRFSQNVGQDNEQEGGRYCVILFFNEDGEIGSVEFNRANPSLGRRHEEIEFQTKEQLLAFSQAFVEINNYHTLYLLSANDFNIGIESCHNQVEFKELFKGYGHIIQNQKSLEKKHFLEIFFN